MVKENKNFGFVDEWKIIREKGFGKYIFTKMVALGVMMLFIYIVNAIFSKNVNYFMVAIIYLLITIIAPIISWLINEKRYKKKSKQV